eukprot:4341598-Lingulodinium_polyedra.AAC.1
MSLYKKQASASTAKSKASSSRKPKIPGKLDDDSTLFTEESARKFLPEQATLWKDFYNSRWLGCIDRLTRSRSWSLYGEYRSMCMVIAWCWSISESKDGIACPHEWILE